MDLLRALGTFSRVAETGSFSAVARESNASQSAISRIIDQLEAHFDLRLLQRTTRHISLTEDGQELLRHARRVLETATDLNDAVGSHRHAPAGLVRLGVPASAATLLVPQLGALFDRHPGLEVEMVIGDHFHDLIEERLDLALQSGPPSETSSIARVIAAFARVLVASPAYLQRAGVPAHPDELANHACLIHETGPGSSLWQFNGADRVIETTVAGPFRSNNGAAVHRATLAGYGIAFLSVGFVAADLRAGRLRRLLPDFPTDRGQAYLIYPSRSHLAARTRVVIDFLVEQVQAHCARLGCDAPADEAPSNDTDFQPSVIAAA